MIEGEKYYYFYEDGEIFLGEPSLKGKVSDFFQFLHRQVGGGLLHCGGGACDVL